MDFHVQGEDAPAGRVDEGEACLFQAVGILREGAAVEFDGMENQVLAVENQGGGFGGAGGIESVGAFRGAVKMQTGANPGAGFEEIEIQVHLGNAVGRGAVVFETGRAATGQSAFRFWSMSRTPAFPGTNTG